MESIAIVVLAYNRLASVERLLNRLALAHFNGDVVDLIVSIDKSEHSLEICRLVSEFYWPYGHKFVKVYNERLGLRLHVLTAGDYAFQYHSIVMFEDDIFPSSGFYIYVRQALSFYGDDNNVAGISLYSPMRNEYASLPFSPMMDGSDSFFMQVAQSWGQCWNSRMWSDFKSWYCKNDGQLHFDYDMPTKVYRWPDSSWKKYFMKYLVEENKYFLYPYSSHSTNATEVGQHNFVSHSDYQLPLQGCKQEYTFVRFNESVKYDAFFERQELKFKLEDQDIDVSVDLYGTKKFEGDEGYEGCILAKGFLPFKVIKTYGLKFRPHEANFIYNIPGDDIFLYDIGTPSPSSAKPIGNTASHINYYFSIPWKMAGLRFIFGLFCSIRRKIFKLGQ